MSYIPFPVDEVLNGLVGLVRANRTCFSPNVEAADLDDFFAGKDVSALPDTFVVVRTDEGEFENGGVLISEDSIRAAVVLYFRVDLANPADGANLLLRQLVQVLRSTQSLDTLASLVTGKCEITSVRPISFSPDHQYAAENFGGWSVTTEVVMTCGEVKTALPTY